VHVINRAPAFEMPLSLFEKEIIEKIEWQFKELVTTYELDSVHCELLLGSPAREITDYAAKNNVDLVVMGSHGRHGIGILFGSTANSVFHRSACDVLAIRL
ncbi:universal stress protein, partial [bacterium AH-315-E07]|nr:universal stress protein [bacterium AH-315-E07]